MKRVACAVANNGVRCSNTEMNWIMMSLYKSLSTVVSKMGPTECLHHHAHHTPCPPSSHLHQPYWLAPCYGELISVHNLSYINCMLELLTFSLDSWPFKMEPTGFLGMSVRNNHYSLCSSPKECSSHLHNGWSSFSHQGNESGTIAQGIQLIHGPVAIQRWQSADVLEQGKMGVNTGVYRTRNGLCSIRQCKMSVNNYNINKVRSAHMWCFGIIIAVMVMVGGVELNPGPQMEEKLIDFMETERREERYTQAVRKEQIQFWYKC